MYKSSFRIVLIMILISCSFFSHKTYGAKTNHLKKIALCSSILVSSVVGGLVYFGIKNPVEKEAVVETVNNQEGSFQEILVLGQAHWAPVMHPNDPFSAEAEVVKARNHVLNSQKYILERLLEEKKKYEVIVFTEGESVENGFIVKQPEKVKLFKDLVTEKGKNLIEMTIKLLEGKQQTSLYVATQILFPNGLPEKEQDWTSEQKLCLVRVGAARLLFFLDLLDNLYPVENAALNKAASDIVKKASEYSPAELEKKFGEANRKRDIFALNETLTQGVNIKKQNRGNKQLKAIIVYGRGHNFLEYQDEKAQFKITQDNGPDK